MAYLRRDSSDKDEPHLGRIAVALKLKCYGAEPTDVRNFISSNIFKQKLGAFEKKLQSMLKRKIVNILNK